MIKPFPEKPVRNPAGNATRAIAEIGPLPTRNSP